MAIEVDSKDLARAVAAGILRDEQARALLAFLQPQDARRPSLQLAHVAFYFGALLIMAALGWLLTEAWMRIGYAALFGVSLLYIALLTVGGHLLWRRGQPIPGGLLGAVAVSLTPLAVFALQRLTGLGPLADDPDTFNDYYRYIRDGWLAMELATVLVGLLMLRLLPFPFIVMPIALALWFLSMDLTALLHGDSFSWEERRDVSFWFGLALLLASLLVDGRFPRDFAFWGYLAGLLAFWGGLSLMESDSHWGKALYCLINLGLMACAILLRRPMFMVFGGLGVAGYLTWLAHDVFENSLLFPVVLSLIGLGVIALGLLYQKHRGPLTTRLRHKLPASLVNLLPALRR